MGKDLPTKNTYICDHQLIKLIIDQLSASLKSFLMCPVLRQVSTIILNGETVKMVVWRRPWGSLVSLALNVHSDQRVDRMH